MAKLEAELLRELRDVKEVAIRTERTKTWSSSSP